MFRFLLSTVRGMDSPRQWAAGLALGLVGGCIPFQSLLVVVFAVVLLLSGANLLTGAAGWAGGWLVARTLAGPFEQLGFDLLTAPRLQPLWVLLSESPGGCWCHWNNTLVTGSLAGGLMIAVPLFFTGLFAAQRIQRKLNALFSRFALTRWLIQDAGRAVNPGIDPT